MAKVIESRRWRNWWTGQTASLYGALPPWPAEHRELVSCGYTIQWDDGTIGTGRPPFKTKEEAEAFLTKCPRGGFRDMTL